MTPVHGTQRPAESLKKRSIRDLRPRDRLHLYRGAVTLSLKRLKGILRSADPSDRPLKHLLGQMIAEEEHRAAHARGLDGKPSADTSPADPILQSFFPSARETFGEGRLHREAALYYAEVMACEQASFFEAVGEGAEGAEARAAFSQAREAALRRIDHLRSVIL